MQPTENTIEGLNLQDEGGTETCRSNAAIVSVIMLVAAPIALPHFTQF
jgi:hypothetical protein